MLSLLISFIPLTIFKDRKGRLEKFKYYDVITGLETAKTRYPEYGSLSYMLPLIPPILKTLSSPLLMIFFRINSYILWILL